MTSNSTSTPSQNSPLDQTIDSTTFGIPQHSQPRSAIKISSSVDTTNTNFLSAKESFESLDDSSPFTVTSTSPQKSTIALFGTDVLSFLSPSKSNQEDTSITMPAKTVAKGSFAKTPTESEEPHFDAATHIYEGVKNAWTWSRGLPVAGSVLGLYETAALTIVSKTTDGKDAASRDKETLHHITGLDKDAASLDKEILRHITGLDKAAASLDKEILHHITG